MKTLTITSLAAATLVGLTVAASADPMGPGFDRGPGFGFGRGEGPAALAQLDLNKDGKITKDEVEQARLKALSTAGDESAGITIQQFETWFWQQHREMMVRAFQRLDRNGDGKITEDEIKTQADHMFDRFDTNGDGVLSSDDRPAMGRHMGGNGFGRGQGPMMGQGGPNQGPMMGRGLAKGWHMGWGWGGNNGNAPASQAPAQDSDDAPAQQ